MNEVPAMTKRAASSFEAERIDLPTRAVPYRLRRVRPSKDEEGGFDLIMQRADLIRWMFRRLCGFFENDSLPSPPRDTARRGN